MLTPLALAFAVASCAARDSGPTAKGLLPDVDAILTNASTKVHQFSHQTVDIQRQVVKQREASHYALRDQKEKYEAALEAQERRTRAIGDDIMQLRLGNRRLRYMNTKLEANLTAAREKNRHLRRAMRALGDKVDTASSFVEESLRATDDTDADVLQVLMPTTRPPTVDTFLAAADYEKRDSLLQVEPGSPEDFVGYMAGKLSEIEEAEEQGAERLKHLFEVQFQAGEEKQAELNITRSQLLEARSAMKIHYAKLLEARDYLEQSGFALRTRVHALRVFAQKMDLFIGDTLDVEDDDHDEAPNATVGVTSVNTTELANGTGASRSLARDGNSTQSLLRQPSQALRGGWFGVFR